MNGACLLVMVHPYTPYCRTFNYVGRYSYFLTLVTFERIPIFTRAAVVDLVWAQTLRAARETAFEIIAYCFMPEHAHLVVKGLRDESDLKRFVKLAKQYSGFYYARTYQRARLWQKGMNDHIIRDNDDLAARVEYVINNPGGAGLVARPQDYPYLGSEGRSVCELIAWVSRLRSGGSPA